MANLKNRKYSAWWQADADEEHVLQRKLCSKKTIEIRNKIFQSVYSKYKFVEQKYH